MKDKSHIILSTDATKAFHIIQHPFMIKTVSKLRIEGTYLNVTKAIYDHSQHHPQWAKTIKVFPLRSGTRQGCPLSSLLFNIVLEVLATAIRKEDTKGIPLGKEEVKLLLFADDMILYTEKPKGSTERLLELIHEFRKVAGYKTNIQKSVVFSYTNNKLSERQTKKTIPFTITQKKLPWTKFNQGCERPVHGKL